MVAKPTSLFSSFVLNTARYRLKLLYFLFVVIVASIVVVVRLVMLDTSLVLLIDDSLHL